MEVIYLFLQRTVNVFVSSALFQEDQRVSSKLDCKKLLLMWFFAIMLFTVVVAVSLSVSCECVCVCAYTNGHTQARGVVQLLTPGFLIFRALNIIVFHECYWIIKVKNKWQPLILCLRAAMGINTDAISVLFSFACKLCRVVKFK